MGGFHLLGHFLTSPVSSCPLQARFAALVPSYTQRHLLISIRSIVVPSVLILVLIPSMLAWFSFSSSISFSFTVLVPIQLCFSFSMLVLHVDSHITSASLNLLTFTAMFVTSIALTLAIIIRTGSLFINILLVICLHAGSPCGLTTHIWICTPSHISKEREKV